MDTSRCTRCLDKQKGAVLVTGLIFLVIITMIVLSMLMGGSLEERMASNARNRQIALQAAEAVIRDAEVSLVAANGVFDNFRRSNFSDSCQDAAVAHTNAGLCATLDLDRWRNINWASADFTRSFANAGSRLPGLADDMQPRYYVELVPDGISPTNTRYVYQNPSGGVYACDPVVFMVTARGVAFDNAEVIVQAGYRWIPTTCSNI